MHYIGLLDTCYHPGELAVGLFEPFRCGNRLVSEGNWGHRRVAGDGSQSTYLVDSRGGFDLGLYRRGLYRVLSDLVWVRLRVCGRHWGLE